MVSGHLLTCFYLTVGIIVNQTFVVTAGSFKLTLVDGVVADLDSGSISKETDTEVYIKLDSETDWRFTAPEQANTLTPVWNLEFDFGSGIPDDAKVVFQAVDLDTFDFENIGVGSFDVYPSRDITIKFPNGQFRFVTNYAAVDLCVANAGACGSNSVCTFIADNEISCACASGYYSVSGSSTDCQSCNCHQFADCDLSGNCQCVLGYYSPNGQHDDCQATTTTTTSSSTSTVLTTSFLNTTMTPTTAQASSDSSTILVIAASSAGGLVMILVILVVVLVTVRKRKTRRSTSDALLRSKIMFNPIFDNENQSSFDRSALMFGGIIGSGAFGQVKEGNYKQRKVAIKTVLEDSDEEAKQEFMAECHLMLEIANLGSHPHIITFIGADLTLDPWILVLEYLSNGSLLSLLRKADPTSHHSDTLHKFTPEKMILMLSQCADGMKFLEKHQFIHRDLAARNILVNEKYICKLADFGLARDIYEHDYIKKSRTKVPYKWLALESLRENLYTSKSDVWSFGILMWETFSFGTTPYPTVSNASLLAFLLEGHRSEKPKDCPNAVFDIMQSCWNAVADSRPSFQGIYDQLCQLLPHSNRKQPNRNQSQHQYVELHDETVLVMSGVDEDDYLEDVTTEVLKQPEEGYLSISDN